MSHLPCLNAFELAARTSYARCSSSGEYAQSSEVNEWLNLVVMMAWILFLRLAHYAMLVRGILPYRNAMAVPV